ncbi:MAG: hypothetical protein ABGX31_00460 [bacterium]
MSSFSLVAKLLVCLMFFGTSYLTGQDQRMAMSELVFQDGRFVNPSSGEPYSGDVISVFETDSSKTRELGTLRDGQWQGLYETYYFNGQLESRINYSDGEFDGPLERYYFDGKMIAKGTYNQGARCGEWFDVDGTEDSYPSCPER